MDNIRTIWGFGSLNLRNTDSSITARFPYSVHNLYFQKQNRRQQAITGLVHQTDAKFRPMITCNISLCSGDDIVTLISLVQLLNGTYFYVAPQYNTTNTQNVQYQCVLDSSQVVFEQLANAQVGQTIQLRFMGRRPTKMPYHLSKNTQFYMIDESGNQFITSDGDNIILIA